MFYCPITVNVCGFPARDEVIIVLFSFFFSQNSNRWNYVIEELIAI